jgi:ABC-type multidrug transport system fused ATPase/permease subunit
MLGAVKPPSEVTQEELEAVCRDANILDFIQSLPKLVAFLELSATISDDFLPLVSSKLKSEGRALSCPEVKNVCTALSLLFKRPC